MEKRRALISMVWVFAFALLWMNVAPRLFPWFFPQQKPPGQPQQQQQQVAEADGEPPAADGDAAAEGSPLQPDAAVAAPPHGAADQNAAAEKPAPLELPKHPHRLIELGSKDPQSGYFMLVTVDTRGASIKEVELNDPRYRSLDDREAPLKVVGDDALVDKSTFQMSLAAIDKQLKPFGTSLAEVDWDVEDAKANEVTLSFTAPDGSLRVRKHYHLNQGDAQNRDADSIGYLVDFDLAVENLSDQPQSVDYTLLGPVGVPLENRGNSRTFVEIKTGTLDDPADPEDVSDISLTAVSLTKQQEKAASLNDPSRLTVWRAPIKYIGADVQYFAALLVPSEDQLKTKYFDRAEPVVLRPDGKSGAWSDITVELTSDTFRLKPHGKLEHQFQVFFGPKRSELLEPLGAEGSRALGWFSVIVLGMLALLHFFHQVLWLPYGVAIMLLTVVVRACLFPISRKIAKNQQRMKELQPKMDEIRKKYADNKEKQAEAMREFMAKHGFNPLSGCLPMFLQLPIFIGLYRALYVSVDLRMAQFLWIDNLAAPDQLFELPFTVPVLGWTHFNLLPLLSMGLFFLQQKLFMPPPTSDEQAMQYKVMNFFTLFLGLMFYRFPAGLCVYFITSSLWGICERKLLEKLGLTSTTPPGGTTTSGDGGSGGSPVPDTPKPKSPGFLARLLEAADEAQKQNQQRGNGSVGADRGNPRKKGRKSKGRR